MFTELSRTRGTRGACQVQKLGYEFPTAVQLAVIPKAIEGQDILARARTGSPRQLEGIGQGSRGVFMPAQMCCDTDELRIVLWYFARVG